MFLAVGSIAACEGRLASVQDSATADPARSEPAQTAIAGLPILRDDSRGFPTLLSIQARELQLNGDGLCEWGIFGIDLYRAALYTERPSRTLAETLRPAQTIVIHLDFARSLSKSQLRDAFTAAVRANAKERAAEFATALESMCEALDDVVAGSTQTFVCHASGELSVHQDGSLRTTITEPSFRDLFVQLYLGDAPPTKALRESLLGRGRKS